MIWGIGGMVIDEASRAGYSQRRQSGAEDDNFWFSLFPFFFPFLPFMLPPYPRSQGAERAWIETDWAHIEKRKGKGAPRPWQFMQRDIGTRVVTRLCLSFSPLFLFPDQSFSIPLY